jgi:hypothetical protein
MVIGDCFHGALDEFVAFVLELLAVAELAGVDSTTVVVVLGRRRRRS